MKSKALISILLFVCISAAGQDNTVKALQEDSNKKSEEDTAHKEGWKKGGLFTLNVAQGSLSNWQGGGDKNSFSAVGFLNLFAVLREGKNLWHNTLDLGYGYINTTSLGSRKSDDRIDLLSKYGYQIRDKWYAGALFNFRTQFAEGFAYEKDVNGADVKTLTSKISCARLYIVIPWIRLQTFIFFFSLFLSPIPEILRQQRFAN